MNKNTLFSLLVILIVITLLGSIALFSYLGISFKNNNISILQREAIVVS
tara:strand:+ start:734 stop:880 length:147 start_codon:yes stop_codon:yes gene_type:complete